MVRKRTQMRGIHLNPRSGQIYINESYEKYLKTMYGRKFPRSFVAMLNDLLDSALIGTLDDMKKVIRYYEWRMEIKDRTIKRLNKHLSTLEGSFDKVKRYAEDMEERFAVSEAKLEQLGSGDEIIPVVADPEAVTVRSQAKLIEPERASTRSAADILSELRGTGPLKITENAGADVKAEGEMGASDVESELGPVPERPEELAMAEGRSIEGSLGMGARFVEAEIGAGDLEMNPQIMAIVDKIKKVKELDALHSDEEIERIFTNKGSG